MMATYLINAFNLAAKSDIVENIFEQLATYNRPNLPEDEEYVYHDWVLVRRKGIELGFTDSEYQSAADKIRWGYGELLLTQVYFYTAFNNIATYTGELPFGLMFTDDQKIVRDKLATFESTRHSYINDTWDVDGYRLSVTYKDGGKAIDRIACRIMATPIRRFQDATWPALAAIWDTFGSDVSSPEFAVLWGKLLDSDKLQEAREDGEIDFTASYGATLGLADDGRSRPVFRSITLHRNRDTESAGWGGEMPLGLEFDDSPEILFAKMKEQPVQQSDSALTGHAVWHTVDYTLHVLYSNLDNRLLRIKLIAPGSWKCMEDS